MSEKILPSQIIITGVEGPYGNYTLTLDARAGSDCIAAFSYTDGALGRNYGEGSTLPRFDGRSVAQSWSDSIWSAADQALRIMAVQAPRDRSYHKTDFEVHFADGHRYKGQYELNYRDTVEADLQKHIREFCAFYSGRETALPAHFTPDTYADFLKQYDPCELAAYADMLDRYAIGDDAAPTLTIG